jgi:hypothetical protein
MLLLLLLLLMLMLLLLSLLLLWLHQSRPVRCQVFYLGYTGLKQVDLSDDMVVAAGAPAAYYSYIVTLHHAAPLGWCFGKCRCRLGLWMMRVLKQVDLSDDLVMEAGAPAA